MQWYIDKDKFPPLMIVRRYLKLIYNHCLENGLLDINSDELVDTKLPFDITLILIKFPKPDGLVLTISP